MIYKVNGYNEKPTFFVDQATYDANKDFKYGTLVVGTQNDAQQQLDNLRQIVLNYEAMRFSICATFVNGNDTTWRNVEDTDPEDTICQVFDHMHGSYTEVPNKTSANILNKQRKDDFLASLGLSSVDELTELPKPLPQPISTGTQSL